MTTKTTEPRSELERLVWDIARAGYSVNRDFIDKITDDARVLVKEWETKPIVVTPKTLLDQIAEYLGEKGDETAQILEMRIHVLTGKLGIGAVLTEPKPPIVVSYWAAYTGSAGGGDGISLHTTEREALEECINALGIDVLSYLEESPREGESEDEATDRLIAGMVDDDELRVLLQEHCDEGADDWAVQEVHLP